MSSRTRKRRSSGSAPSAKKSKSPGIKGDAEEGRVAFWQPPKRRTNKLITFSSDMTKVVCSKGYRMARASHPLLDGDWFWEFVVEEESDEGSHFRLGVVEGDETSLDTPVGFDAHSWAYRDLLGSKVHEAAREFYGAPYGPGDVIGVRLVLPDRPPRHTATSVTKAKAEGEVIGAGAGAGAGDGGAAASGSGGGGPPTGSIEFFKNGESQGVAYTNLPAGKRYFAAASMYMGGSVTLVPGPEFLRRPESLPAHVRALNERYAEVAVEDAERARLDEKHLMEAAGTLGIAIAPAAPK